ncbi:MULTISPECIES: glycosyltransferase family 2 protein [unclassified Streptomyces]|uniref:glycosyltransferase family 2 protein n=1 Tax=unclassified Streptomyces TaxID=2593676 RepID=UPI002253563E|nr:MULTISPECIES: glycosyltransferase family 2 protein [unclassified Streptomyces]MCX4830774.1 glycosyltransferase [Streptomyces sp. NBC_01016]
MVDISVIVPVYNAETTIERCITSVVRQSIGVDRIELIVVDDGSIDATPTELSRLAALHPVLTVLTIDHRGKPAAARNTGIEHARGRFLYFLDADDWLGEETLERTLTLAERGGADIVLGKIVGVGGRRPATSMFRETVTLGNIFDTYAYRNQVVFKLFRRELIDRLDLRFDEEAGYGEDIIFVSTAYLAARDSIGIVSDYDCYYWTRAQGDQQELSRTYQAPERVTNIIEPVRQIQEADLDPDQRDAMMSRHFKDVVGFLRRWVGVQGVPASEAAFDRIATVISPVLTDGALLHCDPFERLSVVLLTKHRRDLLSELYTTDLVSHRPAQAKFSSGGRFYADLPYLRDAEAAVPDLVYDVTDSLEASAALESAFHDEGDFALTGRTEVPGLPIRDMEFHLLLTRRDSTEEVELPLTPLSYAAFDLMTWRARIPLTTCNEGSILTPGVWDVSLVGRLGEATVRGRLHGGDLGSHRVPTPVFAEPLPGYGMYEAEMYATSRAHYVAIGVAGRHRTPARAFLAGVTWKDDSAQLVGGGWSGRDSTMPLTASVVLSERGTRREIELPTTVTDFPPLLDPPAARAPQSPDGGADRPATETPWAPPVPDWAIGFTATFTAELREGLDGTWDCYLRLRRGRDLRDIRVAAPTYAVSADLQPLTRKAKALHCSPYVTDKRNVSLRL